MASEDFTNWINCKLRELNTDETVFGAYIIGILEDDETREEKSEALEGILSEIIDKDLDALISSILDKWLECQPKEEETRKQLDIDVNAQLAKLLEAQKLQTTNKEKQYTEEERRVRENILAQYSQTAVSDEEIDDTPDEAAGEKTTASGGLGGIERNTNAQDVAQAAKDRREQARQDSAAKKQKDKEDREKQRQLREEKKEKRKTVKGERRR